MNLINKVILLLLSSCNSKGNKIESPKKLIAELEYKINATLGEGALWNYKTQELYWVNIEGKQFNYYDSSTKENTAIQT